MGVAEWEVVDGAARSCAQAAGWQAGREAPKHSLGSAHDDAGCDEGAAASVAAARITDAHNPLIPGVGQHGRREGP